MYFFFATTLFITGHSYGAANASLVGILSRDLAEPDSIFCYPFATPNYNRHGLTGDGMKMFSFDSNEDIVPQVPIGSNLAWYRFFPYKPLIGNELSS